MIADQPIKACLSCRYALIHLDPSRRADGKVDEYGVRCAHKLAAYETTSYVLGETLEYQNYAKSMRDNAGACGPSGRLWESS